MLPGNLDMPSDMFGPNDLHRVNSEPPIYLGSYMAAETLDSLEFRGITHIITAGCNLQPAFPEQFTYLKLDVEDMPSADIQ